MAVTLGSVAPVAHLPLLLGVLRKLNVAEFIDTPIPPNPAHVVSCGVALQALEAYEVESPWIHQDTTTIALYGAYGDDSTDPSAPRPT